MITCTKCKKRKSEKSFHDEPRKRNGKQSWCRQCQLEHKQQPEKRAAHSAYLRKRRYGVTQEQVSLMDEQQQGLCALCQKRPWKAVDHDHQTGRVRGLLCHGCNGALGNLEQILPRVEQYLRGSK